MFSCPTLRRSTAISCSGTRRYTAISCPETRHSTAVLGLSLRRSDTLVLCRPTSSSRSLRHFSPRPLRSYTALAPRCPALGVVAAALGTRSVPTLDHSSSTASVLGCSAVRPVPVVGGFGTRQFKRSSSLWPQIVGFCSLICICCCCLLLLSSSLLLLFVLQPPLICFYPPRGD